MTQARLRNFVNGRYTDPCEGAYSEVIDPSTGGAYAHAPVSTAADVDEALRAAAAAFESWRDFTPAERSRAMLRFADAVERRADEFIAAETRNTGKPVALAVTDELPPSVDQLRFFAGAARILEGRSAGEYLRDHTSMIRREPIGVCAQVTPWNYPLMMAIWKIAPALAAGNTVVLKPAELTPLTALRFEQLALDSGIPEGVVNVVVGPGRSCGQRLVEHPDVAKIAFTGSTEVGRLIAAGAAQTIKRVTLELGGKSANVIFADADLEAAAAAAPMAVFGNAGQDCCARSRILVQESVLDNFMDLLGDAVRKIVVGDPLAETTEMGPLISAEQLETVSSFLDGEAPVAIRGSAPEGPGFWFAPTVLAPVAPGARAAREEIFGPIAAVIPFADEADAVRLANDTIYGLSGSVWTRDGARALRMTRAIETGVISVNSNTSVRVTTPFGGFKQSGYGRELGPHALDAYTEVKSIYYATG